MDKSEIVAEGITFDDVPLIPAKNDFVPSQAQTGTQLINVSKEPKRVLRTG